jgi:SAM-dependent methyltransferase
MSNINTKSYWDNRFGSGDWEYNKGRDQTKEFARSQIPLLNIDENIEGSILDFGCGLGDAFPLYKKSFRKAKLFGIDISDEAIKKCIHEYGDIAEFICGSHLDVPVCDIIIASNVFEHLSNDIAIAKHLKGKCRELYIIVPYMERLDSEQSCSEHVNTYNKEYFIELGEYSYKVFNSRGWSEYGLNLIFNIWVKNVYLFLFGKSLIKRKKQIMYRFTRQS